MKVRCSSTINVMYPDIDELLWNIGVICKEEDWDIKLMGLQVRVVKGPRPFHWYGWAHPLEDSVLYGSRLVHPAGRIDLGIGPHTTEPDVVRLFAHELRHIGQFHRGRKKYGYLTTEPMKESLVEQDCYDFEDAILAKFTKSRVGYRRSDYTSCTCGTKR